MLAAHVVTSRAIYVQELCLFIIKGGKELYCLCTKIFLCLHNLIYDTMLLD